MTWIAIWGVTAIASAIVGGILAHIKNRNYSTWIAWSFVIPVATPILLLLMPRLQGPRPRRPTLDEEDRHHI